MKLALVVTAILLCAARAEAQRGEATAVVKKAHSRFQELLARNAPPAEMTRELRALFDIRDLARRALVDHWDKLKEAERNEIIDLLQQLVEKSYTLSLKKNLKYRVDYKAEVPEKDQVRVRTLVHAEKKKRPVEISVDYLLTKDKGAWRVVDVITDDVSMLKNYRSQFNRIIAKEGVPGLLAKMRKKLKEQQ
jgi:phospholipid transport system substrate-binding protein